MGYFIITRVRFHAKSTKLSSGLVIERSTLKVHQLANNALVIFAKRGKRGGQEEGMQGGGEKVCTETDIVLLELCGMKQTYRNIVFI